MKTFIEAISERPTGEKVSNTFSNINNDIVNSEAARVVCSIFSLSNNKLTSIQKIVRENLLIPTSFSAVGTSGNDIIVVYSDEMYKYIQVNGELQGFFEQEDTVTIQAGSGNDLISVGSGVDNLFIAGGAGSDSIVNYSDKNINISTSVSGTYTVATDIQFWENHVPNTVIETKFASLTNCADNVTVRPSYSNNVHYKNIGANNFNLLLNDNSIVNYNGNADFYICAASNLPNYDAGTINNAADNQFYSVTGGQVTINNSGNNVILASNYAAGLRLSMNNTGQNFINKCANQNVTVNGNYNFNVIIGTTSGDKFTNDLSNCWMSLGGGQDSITNTADNVTIDVGPAVDKVWNTGKNVSINCGALKDYVYINEGSDNVTIYGCGGTDTIQVNAPTAHILTQHVNNDGVDSISGYNPNVTISANFGTPTVTAGTNSTVKFNYYTGVMLMGYSSGVVNILHNGVAKQYDLDNKAWVDLTGDSDG